MKIGIGIGIDKQQQLGGGGATPPAFAVAPQITGTAVVGQTLTCDGGTVTGTEPITKSYQWYRGASPIGGATNSTYVLVSADMGQNIKCTVTATNSAGSASADSNTLAILETILDVTANAASAWDINVLLRSAYFGSPLLRVRRSGDNAEFDFGVGSDGLVNWSSVTAFCVAGGGTQNGFVVTAYDQSGNGRHATQSDPTRQMQIASGGVLLTDTGLGVGAVPRAAMRGTGTQFYEVASSTSAFNFLHNGGDGWVLGVQRFGTSSNPTVRYLLLGNDGDSTANIGSRVFFDDRVSVPANNRIGVMVDRGVAGLTNAAVNNNSVDNSINPNETTIVNVLFDADNATAANRSAIYVNNGAAIQNNTLTNAPSGANSTFNMQWGAGGNGVVPIVGSLQRLVIWSTNQSANRTTINNITNDFYKAF